MSNEIIVISTAEQPVRQRPAPSEHLTPKDVVITAAPGEADLAMYLKGQILRYCLLHCVSEFEAFKEEKFMYY